MGFSEAVAAALGKYASFQGRARRAEYWWFVLFAFGTILIGSALDMLFGFETVAVFGLIFALVLLLPGLAVLVRRLHDRDLSGWWALLPIFTPIATFFIAAGLFSPEVGAAIGGFAPLIVYALGIFVLARPGAPGPNRFGDDPKATPQPWGTAVRSSGS